MFTVDCLAYAKVCLSFTFERVDRGARSGATGTLVQSNGRENCKRINAFFTVLYNLALDSTRLPADGLEKENYHASSNGDKMFLTRGR